MSERAVALKDTVEAFVFFRTMVLDSTNPNAWTRIIEAADRGMWEAPPKEMLDELRRVYLRTEALLEERQERRTATGRRG